MKPWQLGPITRTPAQNSLGTAGAPDCSGSYDFDFTPAYMAAHGLECGDTVYAQYWSRDSGFSTPQNVGLTDALQFDLTP